MRFSFVILMLASVLSLAPLNEAKAACGAVLTSTMGTHMHFRAPKNKTTKQTRQKWAAKTQEKSSAKINQNFESRDSQVADGHQLVSDKLENAGTGSNIIAPGTVQAK